jgi:phosphohistidine phosphatase
VKLLIVRHAIAVPRGTPGIPDDLRPLTPRGEQRFRRAAQGLARIVRRPDVLLTSPRPRALKTAEIAARAWGRITPRREPALATGRPESILAVLATCPAEATVAIVGHEPDLSALLAQLLGSAESRRLTLRKGGAALVELAGAPRDGGRLRWYLTPELLAALGARGRRGSLGEAPLPARRRR